MSEQVLFVVLIFVVAGLYASVGHGGASAYLALMGFFGIAIEVMRPTALILNVAVAGLAFLHYYRSGHFRWNLFYPFALFSIPLSYLGSFIKLDPTLYKQLLALCILIAVIRMLGVFGREKGESRVEMPLFAAIASGGAIGLLSGMIGIGGGIILSPLILWFRWGTLKETAAVSALFILVNSIAGLFGFWKQGFVLNADLSLWLIAAIAGGFIGAYWGSKKAIPGHLKQVLAAVLVLAAVKLVIV